MDKIGELDEISDIIVVTNDRFFKQFQAWKDSLKIKQRIYLLNDLTRSPQDKLGAIGDMYFVFNKQDNASDYLVLGGDNLFKASLVDFIQFAKSKPAYATIGLFDIKDRQEARHYGVVSLDKDNRIIKLTEKPKKPTSSLVAMCLYYFPQKKIRLIKEYLKNPANSRDTLGTYINWLSSKDKVYGFIFKDSWFDIGHIHTYKKVKELF